MLLVSINLHHSHSTSHSVRHCRVKSNQTPYRPIRADGCVEGRCQTAGNEQQ